MYEFFFDQTGLSYNSINGTIGRWDDSQFIKFPFNRGGANLSIGMSFKLLPDGSKEFADLWLSLTRMGTGNLRVISVPIGIARLVAIEPLKEPLLGSAHLPVNRDGGFTSQKLFNSHFSQRFFFHRVASLVGFFKAIIKQSQPQGNRCIDTKIDIKGNRCIDTSGLPMY